MNTKGREKKEKKTPKSDAGAKLPGKGRMATAATIPAAPFAVRSFCCDGFIRRRFRQEVWEK